MASSGRQRLPDRVRDYLLSELSARRFPLGARLSSGEIAARLAISRTTVNKAIARLIDEGWVRLNGSRRPIVIARPPRSKRAQQPVFDFANQTDGAYEAMLEQILRGDCQPGELLKELRIAQALDVNPATVRRAAERLCNVGLLIRLPRRGWQVVMPSAEELRDIYRIRVLLEPLAIKEAVRHMSDSAFSDLMAETEQIIAAGDEASVYDRRQADYHFHRALCDASLSRTLTQTLDPLIRKALLITTVRFRDGRIVSTFREHKSVLEALRARNESEAIKRLKNHLRQSLKLNVQAWGRRSSRSSPSPAGPSSTAPPSSTNSKGSTPRPRG